MLWGGLGVSQRAIVPLSGTSGPITREDCLTGLTVNRGSNGTPEVHKHLLRVGKQTRSVPNVAGDIAFSTLTEATASSSNLHRRACLLPSQDLKIGDIGMILYFHKAQR